MLGRPARVAGCLAALIVAGGQPAARQPEASPTIWAHGTHTPLAADEGILREVLTRFASGDVEGAVRAVSAKPPGWLRDSIGAAVRRARDEIRYHRRPGNRTSLGRDERLEQYLRADRLRLLTLGAALHVAMARAGSVEEAGANVLAGEHAVDALYDLCRDLDDIGPVPWPVRLNEPWDRVDEDTPRFPSRVGSDEVRAFVSRWYAAATASLQRLVEERLLPVLIARGLARFPGDPDLLTARGSLVETRIALAQVDGPLAHALYPADTRRRWRSDLSAARRDYERASQHGARSTEAAVRLARVRHLLGDSSAAEQLLTAMLSRLLSPEVRYLALLFRASVAEETRDAAAAGRDYEAAAALMPAAQTPLLALARLADQGNRSGEAHALVARALGVPAGSDPWRRYIHGQAWQLDARLFSIRTLEAHE